MLSDLYNERLLTAAGTLPPARRLQSPDATSTKTSRVCGSEVTVDLSLESGRVSDFGLEVRACALGQASASLVAENLIGSTTEELYQLRDDMHAMLKEGGPAPDGSRWSGLAALQCIRDYPQRHGSTLLIIDAVCACLDQISGD